MQRRSFFASLLAFFGLSRSSPDDDYWYGWQRGAGPVAPARPGTYADGVPRQQLPKPWHYDWSVPENLVIPKVDRLYR